MTTFAQFQQPKYDDAVQSAQRYIGLYPNSSDTPYVYYLAGMSFYNQVPDVMRDQQSAEKAMDVFSQLIEKFPKSGICERRALQDSGDARPARRQGDERSGASI